MESRYKNVTRNYVYSTITFVSSNLLSDTRIAFCGSDTENVLSAQENMCLVVTALVLVLKCYIKFTKLSLSCTRMCV